MSKINYEEIKRLKNNKDLSFNTNMEPKKIFIEYN